MADAFAKHRLVMNFVACVHTSGVIRDFPGRPPSGDEEEGPWAEEWIYSRLEYLLSEHGFISWCEKNGLRFVAASNCHRPRIFDNTAEGKRAEIEYRLTTQLPYYFLATRVAQYLKVVRLTTCAALHDRAELEVALRAWLTEAGAPGRAGKLLRSADIAITEHDDWLAFELELAPTFKYLGMSFTLRGSGLMER